MRQAKWIEIEDLIIANEVMATNGDVLDIYGKHQNGDFMVQGSRSESRFWVKKKEIQLLGDEPIPRVG